MTPWLEPDGRKAIEIMGWPGWIDDCPICEPDGPAWKLLSLAAKHWNKRQMLEGMKP